MNKTIAIVAALAVAALIAIYVFSSSDGPKSAADKGSAADNSEVAKNTNGGQDTRAGQGLPRPLRMAGEASEPSELASGAGDGRRYIRDDGTVVRDHRAEAVSENFERRVTMPKSISPVQPETLAAVRGALRPAMGRCIEAHAPDAPEGSSAQAVLTVSIRDEALTVDTLELSTEGLSEDQALKACISNVMLGHQQVVAGAKDVDAHTMTFPYKL